MLLLGLPAAGVSSVARLLGLYAVAFGVLILFAALRLRARVEVLPGLAAR
jgi:hypothetical protein